ncbi:hypothetical protein C819_01730 [Lachnospiraceae bacterium 10-1]|nr:hypothetical protein C819_01730 [Lachnospiraceae bacterium 10-1]
MYLAVQIEKKQMKKAAQPVSWLNCLLIEIFQTKSITIYSLSAPAHVQFPVCSDLR